MSHNNAQNWPVNSGRISISHNQDRNQCDILLICFNLDCFYCPKLNSAFAFEL